MQPLAYVRNGCLLLGCAAVSVSVTFSEAASQRPPTPPVVQQNDRDGDGKLSQSEFPGPSQAFRRIDRNRDGYLTTDELMGARGGGQSRGGPMMGGRQGGMPMDSGGVSPSPTKERSGLLRFVDVHTHLHPLGLDATMGGGSRLRGPIDIAANLAKAADNLVSRMDGQRIKTALIVVVPSSKQGPAQAYREQRDAVKRNPDRLRLMAGGAILGDILKRTAPSDVTDREKREFREQAQELLDAGAAGFGEMIAYHLCMNPKHSFQKVAPDHPLFLTLADAAAENDVAIDIHMEAIERQAPISPRLGRVCNQNPATLEPTIPAFERLLRHNRKARIVWQHIGWDNTGQMTPALLARMLDAHPNLYLALRIPARVADGSARPVPNRIVDPDYKIWPHWLELIQSNPDRFVIGADEFIGPGGGKPRLAASFDTSWASKLFTGPGFRPQIQLGKAGRSLCNVGD
jgi:hypothetical protein